MDLRKGQGIDTVAFKSTKNLSLNRFIAPLPFFLIPFLGGNHLSLFYITIDMFWIETTFTMLLIISVLTISYGEHKGNKVISNPFAELTKLSFFVLPFVFFNVFSLVYTWSFYRTLIEINHIVWMLACILIFCLYREKEILLKALITAMALIVFIMLFQFLLLFPNLKQIFTEGKEAFFLSKKSVPFASFLNESTLAGYFLFIIPLTLYFGIIKKSIFFKLTSIIIIFGLLFTISRMGIFIASIILLIIGCLLLKRKDFKGLLNLIAITIIALVAFFSFFYLNEKNSIEKTDVEGQYQYEMKKKIEKVGSDIMTLNYRIETWKKTIPAVIERPFFGYGAGTFEYAYRKHYDGDFYTKYAHNILLKTWIELGLFGLLGLTFFIIGIFLNLNKINDDFHSFIFISCMGGLFFALSNVTFEVPAYMITFFFLTSVFFLPKDNEGEENRLFKKVSYRNNILIFYFITVIVLLCSFYFVSKSDMSRKLIEDGKVFEENGFWTDAFKSYKGAIEDMPLNNEGYISAINILINSLKNEKNVEFKEKIKAGIVYYLKKVEENADKDSDLFFTMGIGYSTLGDTYKAEEYLKKALYYYPSSGYFAYEAAQFYYINGDLQKAKQTINYIKSYAEKYKKSGNLNGLFVYRARDMEADIYYNEDKKEMSCKIAKENLDDAEKGIFIISDPRAREYVNKELFIRYLKRKADFCQSKR